MTTMQTWLNQTLTVVRTKLQADEKLTQQDEKEITENLTKIWCAVAQDEAAAQRKSTWINSKNVAATAAGVTAAGVTLFATGNPWLAYAANGAGTMLGGELGKRHEEESNAVTTKVINSDVIKVLRNKLTSVTNLSAAKIIIAKDAERVIELPLPVKGLAFGLGIAYSVGLPYITGGGIFSHLLSPVTYAALAPDHDPSANLKLKVITENMDAATATAAAPAFKNN